MSQVRFFQPGRLWLIAICMMGAAGAGVVLKNLFVHRQNPPSPESTRWLAQLERECDPDALSNNYYGTTTAQPTERIRDEILARLKAMGTPAQEAVRSRLKTRLDDEFGEMLVVSAALLGDDSQVVEAARLMAWSSHPAVRLYAARHLAALRDPRTVEWFEAALLDDRFVLNCDCQRMLERYYPVRVVAELALRDLGHDPGDRRQAD